MITKKTFDSLKQGDKISLYITSEVLTVKEHYGNTVRTPFPKESVCCPYWGQHEIKKKIKSAKKRKIIP